MGREGFQEHKLMLCLDHTLYRASIKLQADKDLGRAFVGLLPYVEGLYHMGYLSKEDYDFYFKKYSNPLSHEEHAVALSAEEREVKIELAAKDKVFKSVLGQFDSHKNSAGWLARWKMQAEAFKDRLPIARELLSLIEKENGDMISQEASPREVI